MTINEKDIYDKAEKLGLKKENVEAGIKSNPEGIADAINKAYDFKFKIRKVNK